MPDKKIERRETQAVENTYSLLLFVAGDEINSRLARQTLEEICTEHLEGRCDIEIVDVLVDYRPAMQEKIIVTPALIVRGPVPRTVIFGNLSDRRKVMQALRIEEAND